jgi:hypothetical protein
MSFRKARTGTRYDAPTSVKGIFTPGASTVLNFTASVQPVTGDDLNSLPEGLRENGAYILYTDFELRTGNQTTKEPADIVNLFNKKYKVVLLEPWQNDVINHYKAIVSEVDNNA